MVKYLALVLLYNLMDATFERAVTNIQKRFVPFCQMQLSAVVGYLVAAAKLPPFYKPDAEERTVTNNERNEGK